MHTNTTRSLSRRAALGLGVAAVATPRTMRAFAQDVPSGHTPATEASPVTAGGSGSDRLAFLLSFMSEQAMDTDVAIRVRWYYADIAQQYEALGLKHDVNGIYPDEQPIVPPTLPLALAARIYQVSLMEGLVNMIGFDPWGADQVLSFNEPPYQVSLFRGPFDMDRAIAAWNAAGYEEDIAPGGETIYTIGREAEIDLTHEIQSMLMSSMNNLAIVDDVIIASPFMEKVVEAIETHRMATDSSALITGVPAETVSAISVEWNGSLEGPDDLAADVPGLPDYTSMVLGVLAGAVGPTSRDDVPEGGTGTGFAHLEMTSNEDAETALEVVEARLETMASVRTNEPWTNYLELTGSSAVGTIAAFEFAMLRTPALWLQMAPNRDLGIFSPSP